MTRSDPLPYTALPAVGLTAQGEEKKKKERKGKKRTNSVPPGQEAAIFGFTCFFLPPFVSGNRGRRGKGKKKDTTTTAAPNGPTSSIRALR